MNTTEMIKKRYRGHTITRIKHSWKNIYFYEITNEAGDYLGYENLLRDAKMTVDKAIEHDPWETK